MRLLIVMCYTLFVPTVVYGDHHFSDPVIGHIPITPVTQAELDSIGHGNCQASSRVMARRGSAVPSAWRRLAIQQPYLS